MQVPTPQADARELRSTRRAYRERRRAAPTTDPRVLDPCLCLSQACTCGNGTWESWRDCQMDRGTGMEWVYSGARGGFYGTLTSARNSRLPATVPAVVRRKRNAIGRARLPHNSPSLLPSAQPLSPSQLLWRREQYYFSILSVYTSLRNPPTPLERTPACANPAVLRVRTVLRVQPVSQLPLRWIASGLRLDCGDGFDGLR